MSFLVAHCGTGRIMAVLVHILIHQAGLHFFTHGIWEANMSGGLCREGMLTIIWFQFNFTIPTSESAVLVQILHQFFRLTRYIWWCFCLYFCIWWLVSIWTGLFSVVPSCFNFISISSFSVTFWSLLITNFASSSWPWRWPQEWRLQLQWQQVWSQQLLLWWLMW